MTIWVDAHLSPAIAIWITSTFGITAPPQIIWLTCGNTSNARLQEILSATLPAALELFRAGEALVEMSGD